MSALLIFSLALLFPSSVGSGAEQDSLATVRGIVMPEGRRAVMMNDRTRVWGVRNATVWMVSGTDTLRTQCDETGLFRFPPLAPGEVALEVRHMDYAPFYDRYDIGPGNNEIYIQLQKKGETLDAAKVTAKASIVRTVGDTLVYNTRLLETLEGDDAMALFLQLPGAEIRDGRPYVNGEPVARTYVGGRLVFGDAPSRALNALPAEEVVRMKVYDQQQDEDRRSGLKQGRRQRVLDIETRSKILSAVDAHFLASGGADVESTSDSGIQARYGTGATANFFSEDLLLSVNAYADNIDRRSNRLQSISFGNSTGPAPALSHYGENLHLDAGADRYFGDRLDGNKFALQYAFDKRYVRSAQRSLTTYLSPLPEACSSYADTLSETMLQSTHSAEISGDYVHPKLGRNRLTLTGRMIKDESIQNVASGIVSGGDAMRRQQEDRSSGHDYRVNGTYKWDSDRLFYSWLASAGASVDAGRESAPSWQIDTLASSSLKRYLETSRQGGHRNIHLNSTLRRTWFNTEKGALVSNLGYDFGNTYKNSLKTAYDLLEDRVDVNNTFDYTYSSHSHTLSAGLTWTRPGIELDLGLALRWDILEDHERVPLYTMPQKRYFAILPDASFRRNGWFFSLRTTRRLPSVEQVRNRIDDTNPLLLRTGNEALLPTDIYQLMLSKNWLFPKKNMSVNLRGNGSVQWHPIVVGTRLFTEETLLSSWTDVTVPAGARLLTYENASPAVSAEMTGSFRKNWIAQKIALRIGAGLFYDRRPEKLEDVQLMLSELQPILWATFSITAAKSLRLSFEPLLTYSRSFTPVQDVRSVSGSINASADWRFAKIGFITFRDAHTFRHFFTDAGQNVQRNVLEAAMGCRLKKGRLILSLSGHDLLQNGLGYSFTQSAASIQQTWVPSFGRYVMLNLAFRFNRISGGARFRGMLHDGENAAFVFPD